MKCNDLCFCGSGKKHKKCHFDINPSSKLADIYRAYKEFDKYAKNNNIYNLSLIHISEPTRPY